MGASWDLDVTDLRPLLTGDVTMRAFIDTWVGPGSQYGAGWLLTVLVGLAWFCFGAFPLGATAEQHQGNQDQQTSSHFPIFLRLAPGGTSNGSHSPRLPYSVL